MKRYYYFVLAFSFLYIAYRLIFCYTIVQLPLFFGSLVFEGGIKYQFPYSINNKFKTDNIEKNTLEFLSKKSVEINNVKIEEIENDFKSRYIKDIKNILENLGRDNKLEIQSSIEENNFILFLIYLKNNKDIRFVARYDKGLKQIINIEF